jgi:hypothetical protein
VYPGSILHQQMIRHQQMVGCQNARPGTGGCSFSCMTSLLLLQQSSHMVIPVVEEE